MVDLGKENDLNTFCDNSANMSFQNSLSSSSNMKNTPIRPLTAAYKSARSENEVWYIDKSCPPELILLLSYNSIFEFDLWTIDPNIRSHL